MTDTNQDFEDAFDEFSADDYEQPIVELDEEEVKEFEGNEPDNTPETNDEPDLAAKLQEYEQQIQQLNHRYNSDIGRLNAYQRQAEEAKREADVLRKQLENSANPQNSGMSDDQWESLKEDFPEIATALEAKLSSVVNQYEAKYQQLQSQMAPMQQQAHEQFRASQYAILEQQHPDWQDVAKSNEFRSWLTTQPQAIQSLVESDAASDAAYLINTYKLMNTPVQGNDAVSQRRQKSLQQARTIPSRGKRQVSSIPEDDFEAAFYALVEQDERGR